MRPAPFAFVRPHALDNALMLLASDPDGVKVLAGGQSLVPMLNLRLARPTTLLDIGGLRELQGIRTLPGGGLRVGALVTHTDLSRSPLVGEHAPLLAAAAVRIGFRAIRNRGTIGGSLAHADPAAELPAAAVALDATVVLARVGATRRLPVTEFFHGSLHTALGPDELITAVEVPLGVGQGWGFAEVSRRAGDFALAGVAGMLALGPAPARRRVLARLVAFGVGDRPLRLVGAEAALAGGAVDRALAEVAGRAAAAECAPSDDLHASAAYRRHLVSVLAEQVILEAGSRVPSPGGRP